MTRINNKVLDEIIDLFCITDNDNTHVYGMDTELFETRQDARKAILKILNKTYSPAQIKEAYNQQKISLKTALKRLSKLKG